MLAFGSGNKKRLTILLISLNVIVFLVVNIGIGENGIFFLSQINIYIFKYFQIYRLFTSIFLHADILHLMSNMIFLLLFGIFAENHYSTIQYLMIYFLSGILGNIFSLFLLPQYSLSLGASGAIFGFIGASYMAYSNFDRKFIWYAIASVLIFVGISAGVDINSWAHLFGGIGGLILGFLFTHRKTKQDGEKNMDESKNLDIEGDELDKIEDY